MLGRVLLALVIAHGVVALSGAATSTSTTSTATSTSSSQPLLLQLQTQHTQHTREHRLRRSKRSGSRSSFAQQHGALIEELRRLDEADAAADAIADAEEAAAAAVAAADPDADADADEAVDPLQAARFRARSAVDSAVDSGNADAVGVGLGVGVSAYNANVHVPVCKNLREFMVDTTAGQRLVSDKATDKAVVDAWFIEWQKIGDSDSKRGGNAKSADGGIKAAAMEIIRTVRYRIASGRTGDVNVCPAKALEVGCFSMAKLDSVAVPTYTMGIEWELHFTKLFPKTVNSNVVVLAKSASMSSPFDKLKYVEIKPDHKSSYYLKRVSQTAIRTRRSTTIAEVVFGPMETSQGGGNTQTSLGAVLGTVNAIKDAFFTESAKATSKAEGNWGWQYLQTFTDAAYTAYGSTSWKDHHKLVTFAKPADHGYGDDSNDLTQWVGHPTAVHCNSVNLKNQAVVSCNANDAASMKKQQMIQTNYMMPVSALASTGWIGFSKQVDTTDESDQQYHMADIAKSSAHKYLTTYFPKALWDALNPNQKADLFGAFTMFYHQLCYDFAQTALPDKPTRKKWMNYGGDMKNIFHHLIKCNLPDLIALFGPELADAVHSWYTAMDFGGAGAIKTNDKYSAGTQQQKNLRDFVGVMRDGWLTSEQPQLKAVAGLFKDDTCDAEADIFNAVRPLMKGFDLYTGRKVVTVSSSAPPAYVTAKGNAGGVLCVVVESRKRRNNLNVAVLAGDHSGIDNEMGPICAQHALN